MASFATADDVATRIGDDAFDDSARAMAGQLCESVTAQIAEAASKTDAWADALTPVPRVLKGLTIEVVARSLGNPLGLSSLQEQIGLYQINEAYPDPDAGLGPRLTEDEQRLVRRVVYGREVASTGEQTSIADMIPFQFPTAGALIDLRELGPDDPVAYLPAAENAY